MFGYVTAYQEGLSEEDRVLYKAYYCGLCEELGKKFGKRSQLILAYDPVFLAILQDALYEREESWHQSFCIGHMKNMERVSSPSMDYAADMNLLLSYHNYVDQAHDNVSAKSRSAVKLLKSAYKKTSEKYPRQRQAVENYMKDLLAYQEAPDDNPDHAANLTGKMLAEVFLEKEDEWAEYLRTVYFYLGKYIYLCDAYVDVFDDIASGDYNPYKKLSTLPDFREKVQMHLESVMAECCRAFEMLPILKHENILRNILYSGVWIAFSKINHDREKN